MWIKTNKKVTGNWAFRKFNFQRAFLESSSRQCNTTINHRMKVFLSKLLWKPVQLIIIWLRFRAICSTIRYSDCCAYHKAKRLSDLVEPCHWGILILKRFFPFASRTTGSWKWNIIKRIQFLELFSGTREHRTDLRPNEGLLIGKVFNVFWLTNFIRFYKSHKSTQLGHRFSRLKYFAMQIPSKARKWDEFAIFGTEALILWNWSGTMELGKCQRWVNMTSIGNWRHRKHYLKNFPSIKFTTKLKLIVNHFTLFWFY